MSSFVYNLFDLTEEEVNGITAESIMKVVDKEFEYGNYFENEKLVQFLIKKGFIRKGI